MAANADEEIALEAEELAPSAAAEEPEVARGRWGNKVEFVLTCIGYSVGLGNVWRFPYVCYKSGGGAFLIPFTFFLLVAGIPLFYLELAIGQYGSSGPITIWRCAPLFKGLGWCMVFISFMVSLYYNVIISWCFFYLWHCFAKVLPWSTCNNAWNDNNCAVGLVDECGNTTKAVAMAAAPIAEGERLYCVGDTWTHLRIESVMSPAEQFFKMRMLDQSASIEETGTISWELSLCLFISWVLVFLCLSKGVSSLGKVAYFTAVFPYFFLTALLIRGLTLPGAIDGIMFYIKPDFSKLLEPTVWRDAAGQVFFSFGIGWGGLIAFSSYNEFSNNFFRDAIIVSLADSFTSFFAGFVIFSIIGFMAHELGTPVSEAVSQGPGLAFEVYPMVVARLPFSQGWAVLFFVMLIMLGLDTQFATVEGVITALCDRFPRTLRKRKMLTTGVMCAIWYVLGLSMCTQGGIYLFTLFDTYAAGCNLLLSGVVELIVVSWIYGADRFYDDVELMLGKRPWPFWRYLWQYLAPISLSIVFVLTLVFYERATVEEQPFPIWADCVGWMLVVGSFSMLPLFAVIEILTCDAEDSLMGKIKFLCKPSPDWGPADEEDRMRDPNVTTYKHYSNGRVCVLNAEKEAEAGMEGVSDLRSESHI
jgi:SNF family Na+-dependent transporter